MARSKYNAKPTFYNGVRYHSKREAEYAANLDLKMKARGHARILAWSGQPKFPLIVNGTKVATYIGDFLVTLSDGSQIVVDVKGVKTPMFKLKAKLYAALYPKGPPLITVD